MWSYYEIHVQREAIKDSGQRSGGKGATMRSLYFGQHGSKLQVHLSLEDSQLNRV